MLDHDPAQAYEAWISHGSQRKAAAALGISQTALRYRVSKHLSSVGVENEEFEFAPLPDPDIPIQDLISQRIKAFEQKDRALEARRLVPVKVKINGPIGICHFGDPHVDDDGTDLRLLLRHMEAVANTSGMLAANLGDLQNNWIGRLSRLWANQSTSAQDSWRLVEWMVRSLNWLYIVGGNHDVWSGNGDPVKWLMENSTGTYNYHGVRIGLQFTNSRVVRVNARHDFHGRSEWNPAHGPMKAIKGGWRDHIATCGHTHVSFIAGPLKDPSTGLLSWAIRCAGYKKWDGYADEKGLPDQNAFAACVTIIDPNYADNDPRLITVIPDVEEAAEFLKWKRMKADQAKTHR